MRQNFPRSNVVALVRQSGSRRPSGKSHLLKEALRTPDDYEVWRRLYRAALSEADYDLARRAAHKCPDSALLLAEVAILSAEPGEAIILLKDHPAPGARPILAWAYFTLNDRLAASAMWLTSETADEQKLGSIIQALIKSGATQEGITSLKSLGGSADQAVAAVASRLVAEVYFSQEAYEKSLNWARRAEWLMPRDLAVKRLVARSAEKLGRKDMAVSRWSLISSLSPDDAESQEMLGHSALAANKMEEALGYFERALAIDPFRGNVRILLGDIASDTKRHDDAYEHYETAYRINPGDRTALYRLAEYSWNDGEIDRAVDYYIELWKLGFAPEEEEENFENFGYLLAEAMLGGSLQHEKIAKRFFEEAVRKHPQNLFISLYAARCLLAGEKKAEAKKAVEAIVRRDPLMPEAVFELGHICSLEGDLDTALVHLQKAAHLDDDPFYQKELGKCHLDRNEWKIAERCFKRALAAAADDEEVLMGLYAAVFYQQKFDSSENILRRVLKLSPDSLQTRAYLAELMMIQGHRAEALTMLEHVVAHAVTYDEFMEGKGTQPQVIDPPGAEDWLMGFVLLVNGRPRPATKHFTRALERAPELADWSPALKALVASTLEEHRLEGALHEEILRRMRS